VARKYGAAKGGGTFYRPQDRKGHHSLGKRRNDKCEGDNPQFDDLYPCQPPAEERGGKKNLILLGGGGVRLLLSGEKDIEESRKRRKREGVSYVGGRKEDHLEMNLRREKRDFAVVISRASAIQGGEENMEGKAKEKNGYEERKKSLQARAETSV